MFERARFRCAAQNVWRNGETRPPKLCCLNSRAKLHKCLNALTSRKFLVLGSGPIIIGQSAEFDTLARRLCKALKSEGFEVVLANSNPATIMTDPELPTGLTLSR